MKSFTEICQKGEEVPGAGERGPLRLLVQTGDPLLTVRRRHCVFRNIQINNTEAARMSFYQNTKIGSQS